VISLALFVLLGLALLVLLYLFARRGDSGVEGGAAALVDARQALTCLQTGLLPAELVDRVFNEDDWRFVRSKSGKRVQELFLRERRRIALSWVGQVRRQVLGLKQFHSGQARAYARLDIRTELALALSFASLLALCRVLEAVFYLHGPYAAPRVVGTAILVAGKVCIVSEQSLAFLEPGGAGEIPRQSPGGASAA